MTLGIVRSRHVLVPIALQQPDTPQIEIEFVVDTGFTGMLTLPPGAVQSLKLVYLDQWPIQLADGSFVDVAVHAATIMWNGNERRVRVLATGERPLLGTSLLDGCEMFVQFMEGGHVAINEFLAGMD